MDEVVRYITQEMVIPNIKGAAAKGAEINGSLWYVTGSFGKGFAVAGPIKFSENFFRSRGYSDVSIQQIRDLLAKEEGVVVSYNLDIGQEYMQVKNARLLIQGN